MLKENWFWVRSFQTVEDLRQGLLAFKETYNTRGRVGGTVTGRLSSTGSSFFQPWARQPELDAKLSKKPWTETIGAGEEESLTS